MTAALAFRQPLQPFADSLSRQRPMRQKLEESVSASNNQLEIISTTGLDEAAITELTQHLE